MSDYRSSKESCTIAKYTDDTVLIGLISDEDNSKYVDEINKFAITYYLWVGSITKRDINRITGIIIKSMSIIQSNEQSYF